jgi:hypothetical protein
MEEETKDSNGGLKPCWLQNDCQLARDQRDGNVILKDIHTELVNMNTNLIAPATNANRVPLRLVLLLILAFTAMIITEHVTRSGYDASISSSGLTVIRGSQGVQGNEGQTVTQKKTP